MSTTVSSQTVTYSQHTLETMSRRHVTDQDQDSFKNILTRAAAANGSEKPKVFLNSLSDGELDLLSRVHHGHDDAKVDPDTLSFEGAYNLLRAPGEAEDLNNDAILRIGKALTSGFPPPNASQPAKDAWEATTAGMNFKEKVLLEAQFRSLNITKNMVCEKHGDQMRLVEVIQPGDPRYVNIFAEEGFSYQEATRKLLEGNEVSNNSREEYEKMKRNLNAFMTQLIEHGVT